ncbi:MAG: N-6 DNA methylase [Nanoarchaeota archaeon]
MTKLIQKRKARRKQTAEDFTPSSLVNEMLDKLPQEVFTDPSKTFCDPAAGNGNFLIEILNRKLKNNSDALQALSTIYGVELMSDNVEELKERLLLLIPKNLHKEAKEILDKNIVCHDALTWDFVNWRSLNPKSKKLF